MLFIPLIVKLPLNKISKLNTEYDLLSKIWDDFFSEKNIIAHLGFQQLINYPIPYNEFEFILQDKNLSYYYKYIKIARQYLKFDGNRYYMEKPKKKYFFKILFFIITAGPLLFYINFSGKIFNLFQNEKIFFALSIIFVPIFLWTTIVSSYKLNGFSRAYHIHKLKSKNKLFLIVF